MTSDSDDLEQQLRDNLELRRQLAAEVAKAKDSTSQRVSRGPPASADLTRAWAMRIVAVLVGALILILDFAAFFVGDLDPFKLGFSLAGALVLASFSDVASDRGRAKWYTILAAGAFGGASGGALYAETISPSPPVLDAAAFGLGLGVNVGIAVALLKYGMAGRHRSAR